jgi:hypothetical protein
MRVTITSLEETICLKKKRYLKIEDEKYEDVIALDKLIDYVKDLLSE